MDDKEFAAYVREMKRVGLDDETIAAKIGISIEDFRSWCEVAFEPPRSVEQILYEEVEPIPVFEKAVYTKTEEPEKEPVKKPRPDIFQVPQGE